MAAQWQRAEPKDTSDALCTREANVNDHNAEHSGISAGGDEHEPQSGVSQTYQVSVTESDSDAVGSIDSNNGDLSGDDLESRVFPHNWILIRGISLTV